MKLMVKLDIVARLPRVVPLDGVCEGCVLGKHHQDAFEIRKSWREKTQLELALGDLFSLNKPSPIRARYVLSFIDDFSKYTWVYLLKNEDRVFEKIKEFQALSENQCG
jgi:hypothetical protein